MTPPIPPDTRRNTSKGDDLTHTRMNTMAVDAPHLRQRGTTSHTVLIPSHGPASSSPFLVSPPGSPSWSPLLIPAPGPPSWFPQESPSLTGSPLAPPPVSPLCSPLDPRLAPIWLALGSPHGSPPWSSPVSPRWLLPWFSLGPRMGPSLVLPCFPSCFPSGSPRVLSSWSSQLLPSACLLPLGPSPDCHCRPWFLLMGNPPPPWVPSLDPLAGFAPWVLP